MGRRRPATVRVRKPTSRDGSRMGCSLLDGTVSIALQRAMAAGSCQLESDTPRGMLAAASTSEFNYDRREQDRPRTS
jgi:hypothetical protein